MKADETNRYGHGTWVRPVSSEEYRKHHNGDGDGNDNDETNATSSRPRRQTVQIDMSEMEVEEDTELRARGNPNVVQNRAPALERLDDSDDDTCLPDAVDLEDPATFQS